MSLLLLSLNCSADERGEVMQAQHGPRTCTICSPVGASASQIPIKQVIKPSASLQSTLALRSCRGASMLGSHWTFLANPCKAGG